MQSALLDHLSKHFCPDEVHNAKVYRAGIIEAVHEIRQLDNCISKIQEARKETPFWRYKRAIEEVPWSILNRRGYIQLYQPPNLASLITQKSLLSERLGRLVKNQDADVQIASRFHLSPPLQLGFIRRNWLNMALVGFAFYAGRRMSQKITLQMVLNVCGDAWAASSNLLQNWLIQPLYQIWDTIRYSQSRLRLTDESTIKQDYVTLTRMIQSYHLEHLNAVEEPESLAKVLEDYESSIKTPIRSALYGDLIRLILIQVQKGKVDLGEAMLSLDKLLRANELNFELLAVIPLMAVIYFSARSGSEWIRHIRGQSKRHLLARISGILYRIEGMLTDSRLDGDVLTGLLLNETFSLASVIETFQDDETSAMCLDSLKQLIDPMTCPENKRWIALRLHMYFKSIHL